MVSYRRALSLLNLLKIRGVHLLVLQPLQSETWVIKGTVTNTLRHYLEAFVLVSASKRIIGVAGMPLVPGYHGTMAVNKISKL